MKAALDAAMRDLFKTGNNETARSSTSGTLAVFVVYSRMTGLCQHFRKQSHKSFSKIKIALAGRVNHTTLLFEKTVFDCPKWVPTMQEH